MTNTPAYNISLLFVEDNDTLRFLYNKLLAGKVRSFYIAENGQEGLEQYRLHKPDLIITDISMPVMDGLQMISHIKRENPEVKVVVMSAYSIKEYFLEAINLGVNGYLIKPVEASRIFSIIADLADKFLCASSSKRKRATAVRPKKTSSVRWAKKTSCCVRYTTA